MSTRALWLCLPALWLAGCRQDIASDGTKHYTFRFMPRSPAQLGVQALTAQDADLKRQAIVDASRKPEGRSPAMLKAYVVLLKDPAPTVRAAAINALGRAGDPQYLTDILTVMEDARSPELVRLEVAGALANVRGDAAIPVLRTRAQQDPSAAVRARCADALGRYPRREALQTLLVCLNDADFAVRHASRSSLVELTAVDGGYDSQQWDQLLAGKTDPFAAPPSTAATPKRDWWRLW